MKTRGQLLLALGVISFDLVAGRPSFVLAGARRALWTPSLTNSCGKSNPLRVPRGGSDEGVTLHGTSSMAEKLYLPGLLDTIIQRTNKVCCLWAPHASR